MARPDDLLVIRHARAEDAEGLAALDRALAQDGRGMVLTPDQVKDADAVRRRIEDVLRAAEAGDATRCFVAELAGAVVGSADLKQLAPALCRHVALYSIGVHPEHQGRGVGRALTQAALDHARSTALERIELYVRADNERAQALYRSFGFAHEGTRARFIRLPDGSHVDDLIFALFLGS